MNNLKTHFLLPTVFASAIMFASTAQAETALNVGDLVGTDESAIASILKASGYSQIEFEAEDGLLEVEATLEGANVEIAVSTETGKILEIGQGDSSDESEEDNG